MDELQPNDLVEKVRDVAAEAVDLVQPDRDPEQDEEAVTVPKSVLTSLVDSYSEKKAIEDATYAKQVIEAHEVILLHITDWSNKNLVDLAKWLNENHQLS